MSYQQMKRNNDKTVFNMIMMMIAGFAVSGFAIWAVVSFILYLVKDTPFNFTSLWLMGIAFVLEIIFVIRNFKSI